MKLINQTSIPKNCYIFAEKNKNMFAVILYIIGIILGVKAVIEILHGEGHYDYVSAIAQLGRHSVILFGIKREPL